MYNVRIPLYRHVMAVNTLHRLSTLLTRRRQSRDYTAACPLTGKIARAPARVYPGVIHILYSRPDDIHSRDGVGVARDAVRHISL